MTVLQQLMQQYGDIDSRDLGSRQLEQLRDGLKGVTNQEIKSSEDAKAYIDLLHKFRKAIAENDKLHGTNYPMLLNSLLSVGEDGLYSNSLRFIFELIQNVDDCDYHSSDDCRLDMRFDNPDEIVLKYNEVGFTPFNVFAITGIAEAAKNITSSKNEIGEKGIGFKSVFGVAKKVLIQSGYFSFELYKDNFTIPISNYKTVDYFQGTQMTLFVPGRAKHIFNEIKKNYCRKEALFSKNPLLFLNKLTSLKMYFDAWRSMEFNVSRSSNNNKSKFEVERDVEISVELHDYENGIETNVKEQISCTRYSYPVIFSRRACQSRYGENTPVGMPDGKLMILRVIFPNQEHISDVGSGSLYSFLPTQLRLTIPAVFHIPFKLDASREFVDSQGENLWFQEAIGHMSKLIDHAYLDWRTVVKEDIVRYLPPDKNESIIAENNGKELCLRKQELFSAMHYLDLPLFFTIDGLYHKAREIVCFDKEEKIANPKKVYQLMGLKNFLFSPSVSISRLGIRIERKVYDTLFKHVFSSPSITADALEYLDSVNYHYSENQVPNQIFYLTPYQIKIMLEHSRLSECLKSIGNTSVRNREALKIIVSNTVEKNLDDALSYKFDEGEVNSHAEWYLRYCNKRCICLDIGEDTYFPCRNAIVISSRNPLRSFAAFCSDLEPQDTFAIRIKVREASERLNRLVIDKTIKAETYLRNLRNIRLMIKDSLGDKGYHSYIELILKSGTDRERFIQELLQNADDCEYPPEVIPTFSLLKNGRTVYTEYNETGFNRVNIRSITAIGESTKNKIYNHQQNLGEKGVGFKTIFAIASEVKIYSGEYAFALTDSEPTIPRSLEISENEPSFGTKMEILLKDQRSFPVFDERKILELCLCLRKLRSIKIGDYSVRIEDHDNHRNITINNRQYIFKRFKYEFSVTDEIALQERKGGTRAISSEQSIVCFVPEKGVQSDYALYSGLPTKHRIKIPLAIDAPFALTTSREEIENESSAWNNIVRKELYSAILFVIDSLKEKERSKVFRFMRFVPRRIGNQTVYVNDISDCNYLTSYDFLRQLRCNPILPTFDKEVFNAPQNEVTFRFPEVATFLFENVPQSEYAGIRPSSIIDVDHNTDYDSVLNALECGKASFNQVFLILKTHAHRFIQKEAFRSKLYEFLQAPDIPAECKVLVKNLAIIPVYGQTPGSVEFIRWIEDSIFVKKGAITSSDNFYVLNENLLTKGACERIFDSNINEINAEWERNRYNDHLKEIVQGNNVKDIYQFLLNEFRNGNLKKNDSRGTLASVDDVLPLKNELGNIVDTKLFICDHQSGYFPVEMIQRMCVHKECEEFARWMKYENLGDIHYDDVNYHNELTADDIEVLCDDYFVNSEEILRGFYRDKLLSYELMCEYELEYLAFTRYSDSGDNYQFPSAPIKDSLKIRNRVREMWRDPVAVVSEKEERIVQKGRKSDGSTFDLSIHDAREGALWIYAPEGANDKCFCQMCKRIKPHQLIEVNNIELHPKYYFPQLRIALCLECSKRFEALRNNKNIRYSFIKEIKEVKIHDQGTVDVKLGSEEITFTATHLAEIQQILLQNPASSRG